MIENLSFVTSGKACYHFIVDDKMVLSLQKDTLGNPKQQSSVYVYTLFLPSVCDWLFCIYKHSENVLLLNVFHFTFKSDCQQISVTNQAQHMNLYKLVIHTIFFTLNVGFCSCRNTDLASSDTFLWLTQSLFTKAHTSAVFFIMYSKITMWMENWRVL